MKQLFRYISALAAIRNFSGRYPIKEDDYKIFKIRTIFFNGCGVFLRQIKCFSVFFRNADKNIFMSKHQTYRILFQCTCPVTA